MLPACLNYLSFFTADIFRLHSPSIPRHLALPVFTVKIIHSDILIGLISCHQLHKFKDVCHCFLRTNLFFSSERPTTAAYRWCKVPAKWHWGIGRHAGSHRLRPDRPSAFLQAARRIRWAGLNLERTGTRKQTSCTDRPNPARAPRAPRSLEQRSTPDQRRYDDGAPKLEAAADAHLQR